MLLASRWRPLLLERQTGSMGSRPLGVSQQRSWVSGDWSAVGVVVLVKWIASEPLLVVLHQREPSAQGTIGRGYEGHHSRRREGSNTPVKRSARLARGTKHVVGAS